MRYLSALVAAGLLAAPAMAQAPTEALPRNIVPASSVEPVHFAEWNDKGMIRIVKGAEADKAPADASHYDETTFAWPTGTMRVLRFRKGKAGVYHQVTFETEIYVLEGSVEVGVAGKPTKLNAGDAVSLPSGVLRNPKPSGAVTVLAYTVATTAKDAKAKVVRSAEAKATAMASWDEGGKPMVARTPEELKKAPPSAARFTTKFYPFDGNSIRVATFQKGGKSADAVTPTDALIYIASGRIARTEGTESATLTAGDGLREQAGLKGHWDVPEKAVFIATSAPLAKGAAPTKPE